MITNQKIKECPACESPLPKAKTTVVVVKKAGKAIQPWHRFKLEFVGWADADRDDIIKKLAKVGFKEITSAGQKGNIAVYECIFQKKAWIRVVNDALLDLGLKSQARVRYSSAGQRIRIIKGGGS